MTRRARTWACAAAIAAASLVPNAVAAGTLSASATVSPAAGYATAKLVATYTFTPKSSCSAYHNVVSWSFGSTVDWATSPAPTGAAALCTSSTPSTAPPNGIRPGSYQVCGTDPPVSSTPACATFTIKVATPTPSPTPAPRPSPRPVPSPRPSPVPTSAAAPNPTAGPVAVVPTPSPATTPGAPTPPGVAGGGPKSFQPAASKGSISPWPWTGAVLVLVLVASAWRFRSGLVGVLENVSVLGRSGADLETELLNHHAEPHPTAAEEAEPHDSGVPPEEF